MRGKDVNKLNVIVKTIQDNKEYIIWSKEKNQGDQWINGLVNIKLNSSYIIIFEGFRGSSFLVFRLFFGLCIFDKKIFLKINFSG
jgi:hypothetical protein